MYDKGKVCVCDVEHIAQYEEDNAKTKECIMFCNQVYGLATLMSRKLKNGKDLSLMEDTLFSIDQTFR